MANPDATLKIKSAFQVTGRQFFILGDILSGKIKIGMAANISSTRIDKEFMIEAIEFALHRDGDKFVGRWFRVLWFDRCRERNTKDASSIHNTDFNQREKHLLTRRRHAMKQKKLS